MKYSELINDISKILKTTEKKFKKLTPELEQQVDFIIENKVTDINKIEHLIDNIIDFHYVVDVENLFYKLINYYESLDKEGSIFYKNYFNETFRLE